MRGNFLQSSSSCSSADFNSRLYMKGNFRPQTKHWTHWTDFNSRLYMRGNLVNCSMPPNVYYFNSRLYMRGNFCLPRSPAPQCISIHASTWEATLFWCIKLSVFKISIHASTWEAADGACIPSQNKKISIHASTWEAAQIRPGYCVM